MIFRRILYLLQRRRLERELADEMAAHREMMGEPAAFGNSIRLREEAADVWGWRWLDEFVQDLRHGLRVLRRTPAFTLTAITVLVLGLGVNLGLFQLLNAAILRPANLRDPETLVRLHQASRGFSSSGVTYPLTEFVKHHSDALSAVTVMQSATASWGDSLTEQIPIAFVSSNFFDEFGAGAVQGRVLHEGDQQPAVVLSHDFWQTRYGADPSIVGSPIRVNGHTVIVAGVASAGFYGPRSNLVSAWAPIEHIEHFYPGSPLRTEWTRPNVDMYARLKPGVSLTAAQDSLRAVVAEAGKLHPNVLGDEPYLNATSGIRNFRRQQDDREINTVILLAGGLSLLVLAVACANLASLMFAHVTARLKEFQMRAALGAGRGRVLPQIMTESALLVLAGAGGGWFAGYAGSTWIASVTEAPFKISPIPDWRLGLIAAAFAAFTLLGIGLFPAWRALSDKRLAAGRIPRNRLQRVLIGVQVLGSCILVLVAGMTVRKLQTVAAGAAGFNIQDVAVLDVSLSRYGLSPQASAAYWQALRDAAAADSRVHGVTLSSLAPMGRSSAQTTYNDAPGIRVLTMSVDASFHDLFRIPILAGRAFQPGDTRANAVIISRRLAERMYGNTDVVGRGFPRSGDGPRATIVGIAADANLIRITASNMAESYWPMAPDELSNAILMARVGSSQIDALRAAARTVNPAITPAVRWMRDDFEAKLLAPRLTSAAAGFMGILALVLTAIGIFGLVAYTVSLRTREIGIRLALGAHGRSVLWLVLQGLTWPVVIGLAVGAVAVVFGLAKPLAGDPLFVDVSDPLAIATALALLATAGFAAGGLPALRAVRIDPSTALREE